MIAFSIQLLLIIIFLGRYRISTTEKFVSTGNGLVVSILLMFFFSALRYNVGYDYPTYYKYASSETLENWASLHFELIPRYILNLSIRLKSPFLFFFITSLFIHIFVFLAIKEQSSDYFASIIIYYTLYYLPSLATIRQAMAISIVLFAYRYVKSKEFFKFLLFISLASLCHSSAFCTIIIYPIYYFNKKKLVILCSYFLLLSSKLIIRIIISFFNMGKYQLYIENTVLSNTGSSKALYFYLFLFLFCHLLFVLSKSQNDEINCLLSICSIGIFPPFMFGSAMGLRISTYFYVFLVYLIPICLRIVKEKRFSMIFYCFFYLYHIYFLIIDSKNNRGYTDYILYINK